MINPFWSPMGERQNQPFQLSFNAALKVDFQGSRVTSDGGLILVRELEEWLGLGGLIEQHLRDPRRGKNTQFPLADLFRQSVYSRLACYEDVNDAERLSQDPTFRLIGSEKISRAWRGADFAVAVLRDRDVGRRGELRRLSADQPGTDRQGKQAVFRAGPRGRPGVASAGGIAGAKAAATKAGRSRFELLECGRTGRCPQKCPSGIINFQETFPDDGDVNMLEVIRTYQEVGYDGMVMPDHVPRIAGDAGGRQAFGYIRALLQMVGEQS